jgi:hypothetical protein
MTLFREIQGLLERTYAPLRINLEECVIGSTRCSVLSRQAGESAEGLALDGRTFLKLVEDRLYLAIFFSPAVIDALERNDPREGINERNIAPLITFIEEIDHGVQAGLSFRAGERRLESEDFARNLEAQAKVDTYLVLARLARLLCGSPLPGKVRQWLADQIFDRSHLSFGSDRLRRRYGEAQRVARQFIDYLRTVHVKRRQKVLREFRANSWMEKVEFVAATQT